MSDKRSQVISTRFSPAEMARLQELAGDRCISAYIRESALATAADSPALRAWSGTGWSVHAAPARSIGIGRSFWDPQLAIRRPADARLMAAALLKAADVAEQRNLADEEWDAAHEDAS